ncbi:MAG: tetratricopeptide repeat protein [Chitinivibrionia bacterium]|nr:tetratricopeptide repeat protein [Chitinivibrionia bacterium]
MKHSKSEEALTFIREKKNTLIAVVAAAFVVVMAVLSINYLNEQKRIEAKRAFGEALITATDRSVLVDMLRDVAQEHRGSVYATYSLMLIGQNLIDAGEYREAVSVLEQALNSKLPSQSQFLTAMILEAKAIALEFNGSLDDAISAYERALSVPNNFFRRNEILFKLALLDMRMGAIESAKIRFEQIIADGSANDRIMRIARNELSALEL